MEKNILKYEEFLLKENYNYIDNIINESSGMKLNEKIKKIFKILSSSVSNKIKNNIIIYGLSSLLLIASSVEISNIISSDKVLMSQLSSIPNIFETIGNKLNIFIKKDKEDDNFKNPQELKLSKNGWKFIKEEEGDPKNKGMPILTAYEIGDGMITIGWGHASIRDSSHYKVGDKISKNEAQRLLNKDLKIAADGVRRIFKKWNKEGNDIKITQDMFDSLVSLAFNMGVSNLRTTEIISLIKNKEYEKAGELIKVTKTKKFPGLKNRREKEANLFLSYKNDKNSVSGSNI